MNRAALVASRGSPLMLFEEWELAGVSRRCPIPMVKPTMTAFGPGAIASLGPASGGSAVKSQVHPAIKSKRTSASVTGWASYFPARAACRARSC